MVGCIGFEIKGLLFCVKIEFAKKKEKCYAFVFDECKRFEVLFQFYV